MRNATGFLLALKLFDKELLALALPVLSGFPTPGIVVLVAPRGRWRKPSPTPKRRSCGFSGGRYRELNIYARVRLRVELRGVPNIASISRHLAIRYGDGPGHHTAKGTTLSESTIRRLGRLGLLPGSARPSQNPLAVIRSYGFKPLKLNRKPRSLMFFCAKAGLEGVGKP